MPARHDAQTLEELAEDLPGKVGLNDDARSRLLCVIEILRSYTDEDNGLTASEIREILRSRCGADKAASEPTVLGDIHSIIENEPFGLSVAAPTRGQNMGFRCTGRAISSSQARLLINIVRTCRFITNKQNRELCDALESQVSFMEQDRVVGDVYVDERVRPKEPNVFDAVDVVAEAIRLGKMVEFSYCYRGLDGKEHLIRAKDGSTRFIESPVDLVYSFGNYYFESWNDEQRRFNNRRLDRVRNIRVSPVDAASNDEISKYRKSVESRMAQTFDMLPSDDGTRELFLEVDDRWANVIFNRFGYGCKFEHVVNSPSGFSKGFIRITVYASNTFFRWLCGMSDGVRIVRPRGDMWIRTGSWGKLATSNRSMDELLEDYEKTVEEYRRFLHNALAPYE